MSETLSLKKSTSASTTVTVGSKMPSDFILRLHDNVKKYEPIMGGGTREYTIAIPRNNARAWLVRGNAYAQHLGPGELSIVGGYSLTDGIPKAFWEEWLEQNKQADFVVNGMIFAHAERASAVSESKEKEECKSGLERLNPADIHKHGLKTFNQHEANL